MQPLQKLGTMAVMLCLTGAISAQEVAQTLYSATVNVPEAEVRSGPSVNAELYATNQVRRGETVEVVKELEGGWLAIKPPTGSFSWINTRFLDQVNRTTWVVAAHPDVRVPVLYGSSLKNDKPTVEGARVQRGTQLSSIGAPRSAEDGMWLPIDPPPGEVRFLRAEAVIKTTGVQPVAGHSPAGSPPPPAVPVSNPGTAGYAAPAGVVDPRWQQAQQMEQAGNRAEAIRLYEQLGNTVRNSDNELSLRAYNRAQYLRDSAASALPPSQTVQNTHAIPAADNRVQPIPVSLQVPSPPSHCVPCQTTSSSAGALQRSGVGRLRRSAWWLHGQPTYALEDARGQQRMYVTAQPGVNLEPYLNRNVELFGSIMYLGYPPVYHIKAVQVTPSQ